MCDLCNNSNCVVCDVSSVRGHMTLLLLNKPAPDVHVKPVEIMHKLCNQSFISIFDDISVCVSKCSSDQKPAIDS